MVLPAFSARCASRTAAATAAPQEMPNDYANRADRHRAVADYVAGMTDRFAAREHRRLTGRDAFAGLGAAYPA